jgi:hypothetical protein
MRKKISNIAESLKNWMKQETAVQSAEAAKTAERVALAAKEANDTVVVVQFEFGQDGKLGKKMFDSMQSIHPAASYFLISLDEESEK